jgi:hypothetical protein
MKWSSTSPGVRRRSPGFKNSSLANTYSSVYVAVSTFFDHEAAAQ